MACVRSLSLETVIVRSAFAAMLRVSRPAYLYLAAQKLLKCQHVLPQNIPKEMSLLQFRAVADQLYRSPNEHGYVRAAVVAQLSQYPHLYYEYIPENYQAYCQKMNQFGTWGDHVTLQAAADAFGVRIVIMTSYRDSCVVEIQPQGQVQSQRILYLSFWAEVSSYLALSQLLHHMRWAIQQTTYVVCIYSDIVVTGILALMPLPNFAAVIALLTMWKLLPHLLGNSSLCC